jgi:hypothetical protein
MSMAADRVIALYVDRTTRRWVARDPEGKLWALAPTANTWDERQPFTPAEDTDLESVPGHYKYLLGLTA